MRFGAAIAFSILIVMLLISVVAARLSRKPMGKWVAFVNASLMIPVIGNLIIIVSRTQDHSNYGYYTYFIGMDIAV